MRRGLSLVLSIVILAAAGYLAWQLVLRPRTGPAGPPQDPGGGALSRPAESVPASRQTRPLPAPPGEGPPPVTDDRIEGVIYDESSRPVADAVVQIISFTYLSTSTRPLDRRFEDRTHASTVSGGDGRFVFTGLTAGELKILRVSKPAFVTQMKDGVRVPARRDFNLVTGARVTGRVLDASTQRPVAAVGIKGWYPATSEPELPSERAFRWKEEVFTNAQGEFVFEGAPPGTVKFMLTHPGYEDVAEDHRVRLESKNELFFRMKPALVIEGVVIHDRKGTPVAGLDVAAFDSMPIAIAARWKARTDRTGRFRMAGVRSGPVRFEISGRGFSPANAVRELSEAENFIAGKAGKLLEFKVVPAGRASGRTTTVTGEPIVRARIFVAPMREIFVMARDASLHGGSAAEGETRTDEKGEFLVDDLTAVPHRLVAEASGFALGVSEPVVVGPDEIREGVQIALRPAPVIRGVITEESRGPVANATVTVDVPQFGVVMFSPGSELGQKSQRSGTTDAGGAYRVEVPYAGKFQLRVDHPDHVPVIGTEVTLGESDAEAVEDVVLKRALAVTGTVVGPGGLGEPGARVMAWLLPGGIPAGEAQTDASGAYSLPRLQAGALYRVGARKERAALTSLFRDEVPAGSDHVDFQLVAGGEIVGSVANASGEPVTGFQVALRPVGERGGARRGDRKRITAGLTEREEAVQDAGGIFRIDRVDPGLWSVQVLAPGYAPAYPVEVPVVGGGPASAGTIVVSRGGAVVGRMTGPGGEPAEGIGITLTRLAKPPDRDEPVAFSPKPWSGRSGPGGNYAAKGLLPGEYLLRVESQRFVDPPQDRFEVKQGDSVERSFTLKIAASLTVVVKDEVREPVPAALILVTDADQRRVFVESDGVGGGSTDGSGRVVLRKLAAGESLTFRAARAGFFGPESKMILQEGENGPLELKLERAH